MIRIRFPTLRTLPSSTVVTPSFSPISRTSVFLPLKAKEDVRDATWTPGTLAIALMISSVMPSLKYSFSGSALMLASGSTAIALRASRVFTESGVLRRPSLTDPFSAAANSAAVGKRSAGVRDSARVTALVHFRGTSRSDSRLGERVR